MSNSNLKYILKNDKNAIDLNEIKRAAKLIKALYHPFRLKMYKVISENPEITVTELYVKMRCEQSVASQHLKWFRDTGIVNTEREGKNIHYSVNHNVVYEIEELVKALSRRQGDGWAKKAGEVLNILLNEKNMNILEEIDLYGQVSVSTIIQDLKIQQSDCSQRLKTFRNNSIVKTTKEGKFVFYELNDSVLNNVRKAVEKHLENIDDLLTMQS